MRTLLVIPIAVAALGCGDDSSSVVDASTSAGDSGVTYVDAGPPRDGNVPLTWVEFSITGCDATTNTPAGGEDAGTPAPCRVVAPATLGFTAIAPSRVDDYLWSFGDGTEDVTVASPQHIFRLPGTYDINLSVGGPGGTATTIRSSAVQVRAAPLGAGCELDGQCDTGTCVCNENETCPGALAGGMCTAPCDATTACAAGVCADLAPSDPAEPALWQRTVCVPSCTTNAECPTGLLCRDLRSGDASGWVKGCFAPAVLGDIGDSCVNASGETDHAQCTSGNCTGEGARGLCSEACTAGTCTDPAACATFSNGLGPLCLKRCTTASDCASDPWLACEPAGGTGDKAFTVDEPASLLGYCAPKRCTTVPGECGADGACVDGYCAAKP